MIQASTNLADDIYTLCDALIEATITDEQLDRLDALVISNTEARRLYVRYMQIQAGMEWELSEAAAPAEEQIAAPTKMAVAPPTEAPSLLRALGTTTIRRLLMAAAAMAIIGIPVAYWAGRFRSVSDRDESRLATRRRGAGENAFQEWRLAPPKPSGAIARLHGMAGAKLQGSVRCRDGYWLKPGNFELTAGRARLVFDNGAQVALSAPARGALESADRLRLTVGSLAAFIPPTAVGFRVVTSAVQVIDHGTEFGVTTSDSGDIEVHVLEGEVELAGNVPGFEQLSRRLTAGSAVRVRKTNPLQWEKLKLVENPYRDLILSTLPQGDAQWKTLIDDHFDRGIDRDVWSIVTERVTDGFPRVFARDGRVAIMDSGYLVTRQEIDPIKLGGIRVRGRWRYHSGIDMLSIVTRADPVPTKPYGHCASGVEFGALAGGEHSFIGVVAWGACQAAYFAQPLAMRPGEEYEFEVLDMPQGFSFEVRSLSAVGGSARIVGTATGTPASPHVVIHNMNHRGPYKYMVSEIDDLQISQARPTQAE